MVTAGLLGFRAARMVWAVMLVVGVVTPWNAAYGQDKFSDRTRRAGEVLGELTSAPDRSPPTKLLHDATCIAVVPGVIEGGLGLGGKVGFGVASCRTPQGWSLPIYMGLKGGSIGLQIGGQSADIVLVFVNQNAPEKIARSTLDLGAEASIAAGPIGRNVSAATDYRAQAEIYSYSKSRGLFGGLKLAGTKWELDSDADRTVYAGTSLLASPAEATHTSDDDHHLAQKLVTTPADNPPDAVRPFVESLVAHVDKGVTQ